MGCTICTNSYCLACDSTTGLFANQCKNNSPQNLVYKNPPQNALTNISLNIANLNLQFQPNLTILFFLKIYSFTTNTTPAKIIIFDTLNNFALQYDLATFNLVISYQSGYDYIFPISSPNFKQTYFGKWLPISISMFRSPNINILPIMTSATIYYNLLLRNTANLNSYNVSEITFSNNFIGLISNINILNSFTINSWGMARMYNIS